MNFEFLEVRKKLYVLYSLLLHARPSVFPSVNIEERCVNVWPGEVPACGPLAGSVQPLARRTPGFCWAQARGLCGPCEENGQRSEFILERQALGSWVLLGLIMSSLDHLGLLLFFDC